MDGKLRNGSSAGKKLSAEVSLENEEDMLVGKGPLGNHFHGTMDFLRLSKGTLADARTTIEELYKWEFDGPFLRDFTGRKTVGRRDVGALERM